MKREWFYQETYVEWNMWGFGYLTRFGRGWEVDERTIFIGPWRFVFVSTTEMEKADES
jgi:hypothetical protein